MAAPPAPEPHQLEQILSLLTDRRETVTLKSVMLELTVHRGLARSILEQVARRCTAHGGEDKYEVVRTVTRREGNKSRVELVANGKDGEGSIFSVAAVPPASNDEAMDEDDVDEEGNPLEKEPDDAAAATSVFEGIVAAHERALAVQREKLAAPEGRGELFEIFSDLSVRPAPELSEENDEGTRVVKRVPRGRDVMQLSSVSNGTKKSGSAKSKFGQASSASAATTSTAASTGGKGKKGKPTTAAAFFGNHAATTKKKKDDKRGEKKPAKKKAAADDEDEEPTEESPTEKENSDNGKTSSKKGKGAGNVDDFVGDVDEDDEFWEEEKARKARVAKGEAAKTEGTKKRSKKSAAGGGKKSKETKKSKREQEKLDEEEDAEMEDAMEASDGEEAEYDDHDAGKKKKSQSKKKKREQAGAKPGAMDAFATKVSSPTAKSVDGASGGAKKRRKKLVERTTVDEDGYMKTETVTEWEDVEEDEAAEEKVVSKPAPKMAGGKAAAKAGAAKGKAKAAGAGKKKQAGLMGFFAKKK